MWSNKPTQTENDHIDSSRADSNHEGPAPKRRCVPLQPAREVGLMRRVPGQNVSDFVGSASGIFFTRSVYRALSRSRSTAGASMNDPGSDVVPGEDDRLSTLPSATSTPLWRDHEVSDETISKVDFDDLVAWTGSYFQNWHIFFPFLHAPAILQHLEALSMASKLSRIALQDFDNIIVRSLMSISLADHRQSGHTIFQSYPANLVFCSFEDALESLRFVLAQPTSLKPLQAAISVQLFLISMLRLNAASRVGGLINRMAAQLGLHRCPARFVSLTDTETQLRQRVFWSIYTIDRFVSQSMGLPLGLQDDDIDVCFPCNEQHGRSNSSILHLRILDLLARHARIRGEIIELRNKSLHYVQNDPHRATTIAAKLVQWCNDVDRFYDIAGSPSRESYTAIVFTILQHESIICLHRPTLAASVKDATYEAALQHCISSAQCIISTLHGALTSRNTTTLRICLLWPSSTWAIWISTFILFFAASSATVAVEDVARIANQSLDVLEHLSKRGSTWPEACFAAIRDLLTRMHHENAQKSDSDQSTHYTNTGPESPTVKSVIEDEIAELEQSDLTHRLSENFVTDHDSVDSSTERMPPFSIGHGGYWDFTETLDGSWEELMGWNTISGPNPMSNGNGQADPFFGLDIPFWYEQSQSNDTSS